MKNRLVKAKAALNCMNQRCRQLDLHNIMIQCGLFDALVRSVMNFGCESWGVYHMNKLSSSTVAWGSGGQAELLHRSFLRSIFQVRKSTTVAPLMNEARRSPIMHSWFKLIVGWWNRIVVRPDTDIVMQALKDNIQEVAFGGKGIGCLDALPDMCWGSSFYSMMCTVQPVMVTGMNVHSLRPISVTEGMQSLHTQWYDSIWGGWAEVPADPISVRDMPETDSEGFKKATYRRWFCSGIIEKDEGFAYHLQTPALIKIMATFRLSSHDLYIELMRHAPDRRTRAQRLCPCCVSNSREDEMHILECEVYQDIRANFADILNVPNNGVSDDYMMQIMNPGRDRQAWYRLANFLIRVMAKRTAILAGLV